MSIERKEPKMLILEGGTGEDNDPELPLVLLLLSSSEAFCFFYLFLLCNIKVVLLRWFIQQKIDRSHRERIGNDKDESHRVQAIESPNIRNGDINLGHQYVHRGSNGHSQYAAKRQEGIDRCLLALGNRAGNVCVTQSAVGGSASTQETGSEDGMNSGITTGERRCEKVNIASQKCHKE